MLERRFRELLLSVSLVKNVLTTFPDPELERCTHPKGHRVHSVANFIGCNASTGHIMKWLVVVCVLLGGLLWFVFRALEGKGGGDFFFGELLAFKITILKASRRNFPHMFTTYH